ncbi:MAG: DUF4158 domain-containing protein [Deltaproteobacteria bacterium]|nr:MAG: DUF4158 domain-containing protein [Deltaproteobacteria bacterium]
MLRGGMPGRFLTEDERTRLSRFPDELLEVDLAVHYRLTLDDLALIRRRRGDANRLGFALQLCTLRFLGFMPDDFTVPPASVAAFLARQLDVSPLALDEYAHREQTRSDHLTEAMQALGFRWPGLDDLAHLGAWLIEHALEHDRSMVLFQMAAEHLRSLKLVRPGVSVLERMVASARDQADSETHRRIAPVLTDELTASPRRVTRARRGAETDTSRLAANTGHVDDTRRDSRGASQARVRAQPRRSSLGSVSPEPRMRGRARAPDRVA